MISRYVLSHMVPEGIESNSRLIGSRRNRMRRMKREEGSRKMMTRTTPKLIKFVYLPVS